MRSLLCLPVIAFAAACAPDRAPASRAVDPGEAARLLIDRSWIDRMPARHSDRLHVYRFTPSMGGGVYQDRTVFRGSFELFTYDVADGALAIRLPETGERVRTPYQIERVDGPEPFDLRLTLEQAPRGPRTYYAMSCESDGRCASVEDRLAARAR